MAQNNRPSLAKINHPVLFADRPDSQPSADFLKSRLGDKLQRDRFDGDGRALFVIDPEKSNPRLEEFAGSLTKPAESIRERRISASHLPASGWVTIMAGTSCCFTRLLYAATSVETRAFHFANCSSTAWLSMVKTS